jgi:hypothetical protein
MSIEIMIIDLWATYTTYSWAYGKSRAHHMRDESIDGSIDDFFADCFRTVSYFLLSRRNCSFGAHSHPWYVVRAAASSQLLG